MQKTTSTLEIIGKFVFAETRFFPLKMEPLNSKTLFKVREHIVLLDDLHALIEQHTAQHNLLARTAGKGIPELDNHF